MILGSLHLIAWNLGFQDHLAWRAASLILGGGLLAFFSIYTHVTGLPGLGGEGKLCGQSVCIHLGHHVLGTPRGIDACQPSFSTFFCLQDSLLD